MAMLRALSKLLLAGLALPAALQPAPAAPLAANLDFPGLLDRHLRVMRPVADFFASHSVRIDLVEGDPEQGEQITSYLQGGLFRQEYRWLGFTEVFAYDGRQHWYGSDINLPYGMDYEPPADVAGQLAVNFAYLSPDWQAYLTAPGEVPLDFSERYAVLRFAPPQMSETLLLLDPADYRLAGVLEGNEKLLDDSVLFKLVLLEDWADFGAVWYPAVTRTQTLSEDGEQLRERLVTTLGVAATDALPPESFAVQSTPPVASPPTPGDGFEAKFSFLNDSVVLRCQAADGTPLRFELDTGANVGLLRRDVARKLGVQLVGEEQISGHGQTVDVQYARVEGLRLEGAHRGELLELPAFPAAVLAEAATGEADTSLDSSLADNGVAGLLGTFVLNSFVVKLDFRRRMATLYNPAAFDPQRHLSGGYHTIPVRRDSMPFVDIVIDGQIKGGAFFNTGAQQFFALQAWACDAAGITYEVESIGTGITVDGYTVFGIIRPKVVQLGDIIIESPTTHLELLAPGEAPNIHRIASFGSAFFERYVVTFDLAGEQYFIQGAGLPTS